jgi:hypothetical protein
MYVLAAVAGPTSVPWSAQTRSAGTAELCSRQAAQQQRFQHGGNTPMIHVWCVRLLNYWCVWCLPNQQENNTDGCHRWQEDRWPYHRYAGCAAASC